jgi:hypothetical protein
MQTTAKAEINASPEKIWGILTDASKYTDWDPGMLKLEGNIAPNGKLNIWAKISPKRAFKVTVSEFVPNRKMVWVSGMPLGLFKGERTFTLEPLGNNKVNFTVQEVFSGLLLPLIGRTVPDMNPTFAAFAKGLKDRAEAT